MLIMHCWYYHRGDRGLSLHLYPYGQWIGAYILRETAISLISGLAAFRIPFVTIGFLNGWMLRYFLDLGVRGLNESAG